MAEAQQAGIEMDAATTDAVLTALGKVSVHVGYCAISYCVCVTSVPVGTIWRRRPLK